MQRLPLGIQGLFGQSQTPRIRRGTKLQEIQRPLSKTPGTASVLTQLQLGLRLETKKKIP